MSDLNFILFFIFVCEFDIKVFEKWDKKTDKWKKNTGNVGEICQADDMGTMLTSRYGERVVNHCLTLPVQ